MKRLATAILFVSAVGCRQTAPATPPEQSLVVLCPALPKYLVPYAATDEFSLSVLRNVYEPLVDAGAGLGLTPALAESWHNPDPVTWVFRLRHDVRLHDGRVLTAADVVRYLEAANNDRDHRGASERYIAGVEARDADALVLKTREPTSLLHSFFNANLIAIESGDGGLVGTGPYEVREFVPGERVVLAAFPDYRDGPPPIRRVEFRAETDAAARARLLAEGAAQLTLDVPSADFAALASSQRVRAIASRGLRVSYLCMNSIARRRADGSPNPFLDRRVREAIALSIDRTALVRGPLDGYADVLDEIVPEEVFGHHGGLAARLPDRARARRLLAEAGHGRGFEVSLDYITARHRGMDAVASSIAEQLRPLGIDVTPRPATMTEFRARVSERRDSELFLMSWLNSTGDAAAVLNVLVHSPAGGAGRYSGFADAQMDALLARTFQPLGHLQRRELLRQVAERVHDSVALVPLYRQHDLWLAARGLDFTPRPDRRIRVFEMRFGP